MADVNDEKFDLEKPTSFEEDCSNICLETFGDDKIIVGNDNGCFITSHIPSIKYTEELKLFQSKEVSAVCTSNENPNVFYVGSEKCVFTFDFRCPLDKEINLYSDNSEDINQIKINLSGLMAACDDSGECKIFDTKQNKVYRTLRNRHKNICSTVSFIPGRSEDIVTGGLDSQMFVWNYTNVRLIQGINTQNTLEKLGDNSVKMFNPPLVNSMDVSEDGKMFASGLGNGTLQIFQVLKGKTVLAPSLVLNRHSTTGVSAVRFIKQTETSYLLGSGGNDSEINIWKFPILTPAGKKNKQVIPINQVAEESEMESMILKTIHSDSKINFLHSVSSDDKTLLLSADQTATVKCYVIKELT